VIAVATVKQTRASRPCLWQGSVADGRMVYACFRWGRLTVHVSPEPTTTRSTPRTRIPSSTSNSARSRTGRSPTTNSRPPRAGRSPGHDSVSRRAHGSRFAAYHGDCVSIFRQLPDACVDFSSTARRSRTSSSTATALRTWATPRRTTEFLEHYGFLLRELYRVTLPGRLTAVHCSDLPLQKWRDGVIGIKDLSGDIIRATRPPAGCSTRASRSGSRPSSR
jgi:hypothetical protein